MGFILFSKTQSYTNIEDRMIESDILSFPIREIKQIVGLEKEGVRLMETEDAIIKTWLKSEREKYKDDAEYKKLCIHEEDAVATIKERLLYYREEQTLNVQQFDFVIILLRGSLAEFYFVMDEEMISFIHDIAETIDGVIEVDGWYEYADMETEKDYKNALNNILEEEHFRMLKYFTDLFGQDIVKKAVDVNIEPSGITEKYNLLSLLRESSCNKIQISQL